MKRKGGRGGARGFTAAFGSATVAVTSGDVYAHVTPASSRDSRSLRAAASPPSGRRVWSSVNAVPLEVVRRARFTATGTFTSAQVRKASSAFAASSTPLLPMIQVTLCVGNQSAYCVPLSVLTSLAESASTWTKLDAAAAAPIPSSASVETPAAASIGTRGGIDAGGPPTFLPSHGQPFWSAVRPFEWALIPVEVIVAAHTSTSMPDHHVASPSTADATAAAATVAVNLPSAAAELMVICDNGFPLVRLQAASARLTCTARPHGDRLLSVEGVVDAGSLGYYSSRQLRFAPLVTLSPFAAFRVTLQGGKNESAVDVDGSHGGSSPTSDEDDVDGEEDVPLRECPNDPSLPTPPPPPARSRDEGGGSSSPPSSARSSSSFSSDLGTAALAMFNQAEATQQAAAPAGGRYPIPTPSPVRRQPDPPDAAARHSAGLPNSRRRESRRVDLTPQPAAAATSTKHENHLRVTCELHLPSIAASIHREFIAHLQLWRDMMATVPVHPPCEATNGDTAAAAPRLCCASFLPVLVLRDETGLGLSLMRRANLPPSTAVLGTTESLLGATRRRRLDSPLKARGGTSAVLLMQPPYAEQDDAPEWFRVATVPPGSRGAETPFYGPGFVLQSGDRLLVGPATPAGSTESSSSSAAFISLRFAMPAVDAPHDNWYTAAVPVGLTGGAAAARLELNGPCQLLSCSSPVLVYNWLAMPLTIRGAGGRRETSAGAAGRHGTTVPAGCMSSVPFGVLEDPNLTLQVEDKTFQFGVSARALAHLAAALCGTSEPVKRFDVRFAAQGSQLGHGGEDAEGPFDPGASPDQVGGVVFAFAEVFISRPWMSPCVVLRPVLEVVNTTAATLDVVITDRPTNRVRLPIDSHHHLAARRPGTGDGVCAPLAGTMGSSSVGVPPTFRSLPPGGTYHVYDVDPAHAVAMAVAASRPEFRTIIRDQEAPPGCSPSCSTTTTTLLRSDWMFVDPLRLTVDVAATVGYSSSATGDTGPAGNSHRRQGVVSADEDDRWCDTLCLRRCRVAFSARSPGEGPSGGHAVVCLDDTADDAAATERPETAQDVISVSVQYMSGNVGGSQRPSLSLTATWSLLVNQSDDDVFASVDEAAPRDAVEAAGTNDSGSMAPYVPRGDPLRPYALLIDAQRSFRLRTPGSRFSNESCLKSQTGTPLDCPLLNSGVMTMMMLTIPSTQPNRPLPLQVRQSFYLTKDRGLGRCLTKIGQQPSEGSRTPDAGEDASSHRQVVHAQITTPLTSVFSLTAAWSFYNLDARDSLRVEHYGQDPSSGTPLLIRAVLLDPGAGPVPYSYVAGGSNLFKFVSVRRDSVKDAFAVSSPDANPTTGRPRRGSVSAGPTRADGSAGTGDQDWSEFVEGRNAAATGTQALTLTLRVGTRSQRDVTFSRTEVCGPISVRVHPPRSLPLLLVYNLLLANGAAASTNAENTLVVVDSREITLTVDTRHAPARAFTPSLKRFGADPTSFSVRLGSGNAVTIALQDVPPAGIRAFSSGGEDGSEHNLGGTWNLPRGATMGGPPAVLLLRKVTVKATSSAIPAHAASFHTVYCLCVMAASSVAPSSWASRKGLPALHSATLFAAGGGRGDIDTLHQQQQGALLGPCCSRPRRQAGGLFSLVSAVSADVKMDVATIAFLPGLMTIEMRTFHFALQKGGAMATASFADLNVGSFAVLRDPHHRPSAQTAASEERVVGPGECTWRENASLPEASELTHWYQGDDDAGDDGGDVDEGGVVSPSPGTSPNGLPPAPPLIEPLSLRASVTYEDGPTAHGPSVLVTSLRALRVSLGGAVTLNVSDEFIANLSGFFSPSLRPLQERHDVALSKWNAPSTLKACLDVRSRGQGGKQEEASPPRDSSAAAVPVRRPLSILAIDGVFVSGSTLVVSWARNARKRSHDPFGWLPFSFFIPTVSRAVIPIPAFVLPRYDGAALTLLTRYASHLGSAVMANVKELITSVDLVGPSGAIVGGLLVTAGMLLSRPDVPHHDVLPGLVRYSLGTAASLLVSKGTSLWGAIRSSWLGGGSAAAISDAVPSTSQNSATARGDAVAGRVSAGRPRRCATTQHPPQWLILDTDRLRAALATLNPAATEQQGGGGSIAPPKVMDEEKALLLSYAGRLRRSIAAVEGVSDVAVGVPTHGGRQEEGRSDAPLPLRTCPHLPPPYYAVAAAQFLPLSIFLLTAENADEICRLLPAAAAAHQCRTMFHDTLHRLPSGSLLTTSASSASLDDAEESAWAAPPPRRRERGDAREKVSTRGGSFVPGGRSAAPTVSAGGVLSCSVVEPLPEDDLLFASITGHSRFSSASGVSSLAFPGGDERSPTMNDPSSNSDTEIDDEEERRDRPSRRPPLPLLTYVMANYAPEDAAVDLELKDVRNMYVRFVAAAVEDGDHRVDGGDETVEKPPHQQQQYNGGSGTATATSVCDAYVCDLVRQIVRRARAVMAAMDPV